MDTINTIEVNNACKHHQHHNHQQNHHISEGCSHFGACLDNTNRIMSRLSPYNDHNAVIPLPHDGCIMSSFGVSIDTMPTIHPADNSSSSSMAIGIDHGNLLQRSYNRVIHSPRLQLDGIRYDSTGGYLDPHSPMCMVPLPEHIGEPGFIRRRNERERERVRCVNDGYDRLKEHLPLADKDRRLSKVETLRGAIKYIRQLKRLLEDSDDEIDYSTKTKKRYNNITSRKLYRSSSLSSSEPDSSLSDS